MENNELIKRAEDLARRCERTGCITATGFLSPAEQYLLDNHFRGGDCTLLFVGGAESCERARAFFLPDYMEREYFDASEYIRAIKLTAHFGTPGHRDYMGALLGMGVGREWIGDIWVDGANAYVFCMESVMSHLLSIDKVGRCGVTAEEIGLASVPERKLEVKERSFSVMSMRLDAVAGGMFDMSRTEAAKHINEGNVSLNYQQCFKTDSRVQEGDIISLRGAGKGRVTGTGGTSRKGRLFVYTEIFK